MRQYKILGISPVSQYSNKKSLYWRKALVENVLDQSDSMTLTLNPHAVNEASGVMMVDDIPCCDFVFRFQEQNSKALDSWDVNDIINEL